MKHLDEINKFFPGADNLDEVIRTLKNYSKLELEEKLKLITDVKEKVKAISSTIPWAIANHNDHAMPAQGLNRLKEFVHLVEQTIQKDKDKDVKNKWSGFHSNIHKIMRYPKQPL